MEQPLLENKDNIEFGVIQKGLRYSQITPIGKLQILDFSANYNNLQFEQIPQGFQPSDKKKFKIDKQYGFYYTINKMMPVFHPDNPLLILWQLSMVFIIFFYFFYIPFKIAFSDIGNDTSPDDIFWIKNFVEFSILVLAIDLFVSFNTGFYDYGQLILKRRSIAINYLKWAFELDLLGVISLSVALALNNHCDVLCKNIHCTQHYCHYIDWIRLLFYFRLYYVYRFNIKVEELLQLYKCMLFQQINFFILVWLAVYRIFKLILVVLIVTHTMACIFYGIGAKNLNEPDKYSWIQYNDYYVKDSEFDSYRNQIWPMYVLSLYWSLTTVSTVGYGDITPKSTEEIGIVLFTMVLAGMVFAFNVASIREVIIELNDQNNKFSHYQMVLNRYMNMKKISANTQVRVREYLEHLWKEEENRDHSVEDMLLNRLAPELKEQIYYEQYIDFLTSPAFLRQQYSFLFLRSISLDIEEDHFGPDEIILHQDIEKDDQYIYYMVKGDVIIYIDRGQGQYPRHFDTQIKIDSIGENQCFGAESFFIGEKYQFSVKALKYTKINKIGRQKFLEKLKNFPRDFEKYHSLIAERYSDKFYYLIGIECLTCKDQYHYCIDCPVTHFVPDRQLIISHAKLQLDVKNRRKQHQRYKNVKDRSRYKVSIMRQQAHEIMLNIKQSRVSNVRRISLAEVYELGQSKLAAYIDQQEEDNMEELNENELRKELFEMKSMLSKILNQMGLETKDEIVTVNQKPFLPQKPSFEPSEISFEIDKIKSYEYFQPWYNFSELFKNFR